MSNINDTCEILEKGFLKKMSNIAGVGLLSTLLTVISTFTIITFIFFKGTFSLPQVKPLLHLIIADFLLSYVWFASNIDYMMINDEQKSYSKSVASKCLIWQVLAETLHLTTFGFTINYSVNVYLSMRERAQNGYLQEGTQQKVGKLETVGKLKKYLYIAFWILPFLSMLPIIVNIDEKHICRCERCVILIDVPRLVNTNLFYQSYGYVLLVCALLTSMCSVVVLYVLTLRLYWKTSPGFVTDRERKKFRNYQRRITLYVSVFLVCWFPALSISIMKSYEMIYYKGTRLKQLDIQTFYWLYILQALLTPLQGFFNTIVYGWTRKSFRRASRPVQEDYRPFFTDHESDSYLRSPVCSEISYTSLPSE